jgi:hypothetical protein
MPRVAAFTLGLLLIPAMCLGQNPAARTPVQPQASQPPAPQPPALPVMVAPWPQPDAYESRIADSRELVCRNAAWKAEQRRQRMAGLAWLGYSPLRPPASPVPSMGTYSGFVGVGSYFPFPTFYHPGGPVMVLGQAGSETSR